MQSVNETAADNADTIVPGAKILHGVVQQSRAHVRVVFLNFEIRTKCLDHGDIFDGPGQFMQDDTALCFNDAVKKPWR